MPAAASPRQHQPHAAWSLGGLSALHVVGGHLVTVPSDDLFACNPSRSAGKRTALRRPTRGLPWRHGAPSKCLTAMEAQVQNPETDPKVCSPWHGVASGVQSWPRFPSLFLTQTSRPLLEAPRRRGRAEGHQQTRRDGVLRRQVAAGS